MDEDTPVYWDLVNDTPMYFEVCGDWSGRQLHELLDGWRREHRLVDILIEAAYATHYGDHEGPIMFCQVRACRAAWGAA